MTASDKQLLFMLNIAFIGIMLLFIFIGIIRPIKEYFRPSRPTGRTLYEFRASRSDSLKWCIGDVIGAAVWVYFAVKDREMSVFLLFIVLFLFRQAVFSFFPEKICENGVVLRIGFLAWNEITDVSQSGTSENAIELTLKQARYIGNSNKYTIYSDGPVGEAVNTVRQYLGN